jgi:hypothetical protein
MDKKQYEKEKYSIYEYRFTSQGPNGSITKVVQIQPLTEDIYNFSFGDLQQDGTVDDTVETNNRDVVKVLSTIIGIMQDFMRDRPDAKVFFTGSTQQRTNVYRLLISRYYKQLSRIYFISALEEIGGITQEIKFDPKYKGLLVGFFIMNK